MNISLLAIGKTDKATLSSLTDDYTKRLGHYVNFTFDVIPDLKNTKNLNEAQQKEKEGELILKRIKNSDHLILLDEKGKMFNSVEFSEQLQKKMNIGLKQIIFVIGGPYGFSPSVYARANEKLSLSKMTFSHQMIRLFMVEQLYRAFTIIKNEPYHHR
ncbi:23S rRNA (pseudouridine(1915)-N(3))-methyltransferase RlmH [Spongiivirga sp. MCCC 1A20706]|uniref:23S rRNA (pseudouridine(1915)-N(3))-methyltransferase RlmH n=1 Tax=Spongiivirga sp. MCCC 1A20706 TaxID=3160963 RepID=UPI003977BF22